MIETIALVLIISGLVFFLTGSIGLLRLPDLPSRLHALAKADNLGLALVAAGTILIDASLLNAFKIILIWVLVMAASSVSSHMIARAHLQKATRDE